MLHCTLSCGSDYDHWFSVRVPKLLRRSDTSSRRSKQLQPLTSAGGPQKQLHSSASSRSTPARNTIMASCLCRSRFSGCPVTTLQLISIDGLDWVSGSRRDGLVSGQLISICGSIYLTTTDERPDHQRGALYPFAAPVSQLSGHRKINNRHEGNRRKTKLLASHVTSKIVNCFDMFLTFCQIKLSRALKSEANPPSASSDTRAADVCHIRS